MAGLRITLLVVAALSMAQGHSLEKRAAFNLTEAAATILTKSAELKATVDTATATLTSYINIARATQAQVKANAQAKIDAIVANATTNAATQTGPQACLTQKVGQVEGLGLQTMVDIVDCLGKKITELEDMLQTVITSGNSALTIVPDAVAQINQCHTTGGFFEAFCEVMATVQFVTKANTVILNITGVVAQATSLVATIQVSLTTCATVQVTKMATKAAILVAELAFCSVTSLG